MTKTKQKINSDAVDALNYALSCNNERQPFFNLLRKLGLRSPPEDILDISGNFGTPDMIMMDPVSLKAYMEAFGIK